MDDPSVLQSVLSPAGPQAASIERLWWLMFWVTTAVFVVVTAAIAGALWPGRRPVSARALFGGVAAAVAVTVVTLFVLLVASVWTGRATASPQGTTAVTINLIGHQWWWEAEYEGDVPAHGFRTANELHIPVGRPVILKVTSRDVIHSIWVPNLHGKRDLIPGYTTALWIQADRPGVYRGQCAEFCGMQHAKMALFVTAEEPAAFERWRANQLKPSVEPATEPARRGRDVFLGNTCPTCHTVRGTIAGATAGPDLTHLASRGTIAAGTLPNTHGHLAGWVVDPQGTKPGTRMPSNRLPSADLVPLLTYLESLQ